MWTTLRTLCICCILMLIWTYGCEGCCAPRDLYEAERVHRPCGQECWPGLEICKDGKICKCDHECGFSCINPNNTCGDPPRPEHAIVSISEPPYQYDDIVEYECQAGYKKYHSRKLLKPIMCHGEKNWTIGNFYCVDCEYSFDCIGGFATSGVLRGSDAEKGEFPWHAMIIKDVDSSRSKTNIQRAINQKRIKDWLEGGGSLISNKWVLTAAHLFRGVNHSKDWHRDYKIILGIHKLTMAEVMPNAKFFEPEEIILHEDFKIDLTRETEDFDYDVALIKLGQEYKLGKRGKLYPSTGYGWVTYTNLIRQVHLPCMGDSSIERLLANQASQTSKMRATPSAEEICKFEENKIMAECESWTIVIGYGNTETEIVPTWLQFGSVEIKSPDKCSNAISDLRLSDCQKVTSVPTHYRYTDRMLCALSKMHDFVTDACQGDSGGSLSRRLYVKGRSTWVQIGIVSWGHGCATKYCVNGTQRNFPGYYTNIFSVMNWIKSRIDAQEDLTCGPKDLFVGINTKEELSSPGWPRKYNRDSSCEWTIRASRKHVIRFRVVVFQTANCCDRLKIFDVGVNEVLRELSGNISRGWSFVSRTNHVIASFSSESTFADRYFFIQLSALERTSMNETWMSSVPTAFISTPQRDRTCKPKKFFVRLNKRRRLKSPGWPRSYKHNITCDWMYEAPPDRVIRFRVVVFHTVSCCDKLKFFDVGTNETLRELSGYINRGTIFHSSSNRVYVSFSSGSKYKIRGFSIKISAYEPRTSKTASTGCYFSQVVRNRTKYLESPNYPSSYNSNDNCTYRLRSPRRTLIKLESITFLTERCCDKLTIRDKAGLSIFWAGSITNQRRFISQSNNLELRFTSDSSIQAVGFRIAYSIVSSELSAITAAFNPTTAQCSFNLYAELEDRPLNTPRYPQHYPPSQDYQWTLQAKPGYQVQFTVHSGETEARHDYLEVFDGPSRYHPSMGRIKGDVSLSRSFTSTSQNLTVRFISDSSVELRGFTGSYRLTQCGFNRYAALVYRTLSNTGYREDTPPSRDCQWTLRATSGYQVQLIVQSEETDAIHGYLEICDGPSISSPSLGRVDGDVPLRTFTSTTGYLTVRFISVSSVKSLDFIGSYRLTQCGFNRYASLLDKPLNTPGYPQHYPPSQDCQWTLRATSGYQVHFTVHSGETDASHDYLEVFDGPSIRSPSLGRVEGVVSVLRSFASTNGHLTVQFISDSSVELRGFTGSYRLTPCGFDRYALSEDRLLNTPGYPQRYPPSQDCQWTLRATSGYQVQFIVHSGETDASHDYLEVFDGPSISSPSLGRVDGDVSVLRTFTSTSRHLTVRFISDSSVELRGFTGSYRLSCSSYNMDIMFLMDGSGSIGSSEFKTMIEFLKGVVAGINLVQNKVGVIQYSHWYWERPKSEQRYIQTEIALGQYTETTEFNAAADRIDHHGFTTFTGHAIEKAVVVDLASSDRFNDSCTKKVIIVITDGRSSDSEMLEVIVPYVKRNNVEFVAVGVKDYNMNELQLIAGNRTDRLFVAQTFNSLLQQVPIVQVALMDIVQSSETFDSP